MYVNPGPWVQVPNNSTLTGAQSNGSYADLGNIQDTVDFSNSRLSTDPVASQPSSSNNPNRKQNSSLPPWLLAIGAGALAIGAGILLKRGGFRFKNHLSRSSPLTSSHEDVRPLSHGSFSGSHSMPGLTPEKPVPIELPESLKIERKNATRISVENGYAKEWAEFQNNPEALQQLKDGIGQSLNQKRFLGKGSFAYAYSIPHASRYQFASPVLRVDHLQGKVLSKDLNNCHLEVQQHLFPGQKRFLVGNTQQIQTSYKILPIKYGPEAKSLLESDDIGIPFAAVIPKGHPAYSREFIQPKELDNVKGTLLRQVDGKKLSHRQSVNEFADQLSRYTHFKEVKASLESKQKTTPLTKPELRRLEKATRETEKSTRYQLIEDMRAYHKANPTDPNFEKLALNKANYPEGEWEAYGKFRDGYLLEIKKLADMPDKTADEIMNSLKSIKQSGANFDFSHGANLFVKRTKNPETGEFEESWKFIDLALTDAEKGKVHTYNPYAIDDFVDVALGKTSWRKDFLPSHFIFDSAERQGMQENLEKFLSNLERAAQTHGITDKEGRIWTADKIRIREGIKKD